MAVHAHPDDESSKGAAVMARYVAEGARVRVVSCTGGERGDVLNATLKNDPHIARDIAQVRRDEMAAAAAILGVEHTWLGFVDSGLPEGDPLRVGEHAGLRLGGIVAETVASSTAISGGALVEIYTLDGQLVYRDRHVASDAVFWNGVNLTGEAAAPGTYLVRVELAGQVRVLPLALVR